MEKAVQHLENELTKSAVVGISNIDTRALTRHLRDCARVLPMEARAMGDGGRLRAAIAAIVAGACHLQLQDHRPVPAQATPAWRR